MPNSNEAGGAEHLPGLLNLILSSPAKDLSPGEWADFLKKVFRPLDLAAIAEPIADPSISYDGIVLEVPGVRGNSAFRLRFAEKGRRLFSAHDVEFLRQTLLVIRTSLLLRTTLEEASQRERVRIAGEIHDHVGASLLTILRHDDERVREMARLVSKELRTAVSYLTDEVVSLADLLPGWHSKVRRQCEACGVALRWDEPARAVDTVLATADSLNLCGIAQEAVANALRHGGPRNLTVNIAVQGQKITLVVEDDGTGFNASGSRQGFGMNNIKRRAAELGGSVAWNSVEPHGCQMTAVLTIRKLP